MSLSQHLDEFIVNQRNRLNRSLSPRKDMLRLARENAGREFAQRGMLKLGRRIASGKVPIRKLERKSARINKMLYRALVKKNYYSPTGPNPISKVADYAKAHKRRFGIAHLHDTIKNFRAGGLKALMQARIMRYRPRGD